MPAGVARAGSRSPLLRLARRSRAWGDRGPGDGGPSDGQVLVLFALGITVLLGFAGVAFDVGRFYSERRFLQNAADAAALAGANALIRGGTIIDADNEARAILTRNFVGNPNGVTPALPPITPVYEDGHAGSASHLRNGILVTGGTVRVAVENTVPYTFARILGFTDNTVGARAMVRLEGNLLPIAVRRFINAPGPNAGAMSPCPENPNLFIDVFATADTACLGSDTDPSLRTPPSAGSNFDSTNPGSNPASHGPITTILGQGAQPSNGADFRGFVALDIRNFASATSRLYYNGVTSGTQPNTLKQMEAGWITTGGYPGPMFPPATTPPDANDQIGIMSGNDTGIAIDALNERFAPGDEILVAVYPGTVMAIPDFAISPPAQITLPEDGETANAGSLRVSRNQAFTGTVTLSTLPDVLDPANPLMLATPTITSDPPITYTPNPVTPALGSGTAVDMTDVETDDAVPGIYILWIRGEAGSPYLTTKLEPVAVKIGTVTRDFTITADAASKDAANVGDSVSFALSLTNSPNKNTAFGNPVALSVDTVPAGASVSFSSASVSPSRNGTGTILTVNTGTLAPGDHRLVVRATAMNGDSTPRKVTHLLPLTVRVAPTTSRSDEYVDVVGFAAMRIATANANAVTAYAITPLIPDMNDPQLRRAQIARLVPWS